MRRQFTTLASGVLVGTFATSAAFGQDEGIRFTASHRAPIVAATTVTALFTVTNRQTDSVSLMPHLDVPASFTVLTGMSVFALAPGSSEVLPLSVVVPRRVRAGTYVLRISLTTPRLFTIASDSVLIVVPERRELSMDLLDKPSFTISPRNYDVSFLVRNEGNTTTALRLTATSSHGTAELLESSSVHLDPDATRVVRVRVRPGRGISRAVDDVVEVVARHADDSTHSARSSARVTIVPQAVGAVQEFARLPAQLRLRAAGASGVAPFEVVGLGALREGGPERLEFLFRGRGDRFSPFGERDEYRLSLDAPSWRLRAGDHLYALSPLTSAGRVGAGASASVTRGRWTLGTQAQEFRREPGGDRELAAFVAASIAEGERVAVNAVERMTATGTASVLGLQASLLRLDHRLELELARSGGARSGNAGTARVSGGRGRVTYDIGILEADTSFAGSQSGSTRSYASATARASRRVSVSVSGSRQTIVPGRKTSSFMREHMDFRTLSASLDRLTLELRSIERSTSYFGHSITARQQSARLRGDRNWGPVTLSLGVEQGVGGTSSPTSTAGSYTDIQASARTAREWASFDVFASRSAGSSLTNGGPGAYTTGGTTSIRFPSATTLALTGVATLPGEADSRAQFTLDARIDQALARGSSLSLRMRLTQSPSPTSDRNAAFLEYRLPLAVPVARSRTPGRVRGRIVDATTGRGVPNAIVRVAGEVGITNTNGDVAFRQVPAGAHRVSLAQEVSLADAVVLGDPTLRVDSARGRPLSFRLQVVRAGRIDVVVKRFTVIRTALDRAADSLASEPLANVTLKVIGQRDTLYRNTDEKGRASFIDLPPGAWTVAVHSDAPSFHAFEPDRLALEVEPGETRSLEFRLLPRKRDVKIIGGSEELRPEPRTRERGTGNREKSN